MALEELLRLASPSPLDVETAARQCLNDIPEVATLLDMVGLTAGVHAALLYLCSRCHDVLTAVEASAEGARHSELSDADISSMRPYNPSLGYANMMNASGVPIRPPRTHQIDSESRPRHSTRPSDSQRPQETVCFKPQFVLRHRSRSTMLIMTWCLKHQECVSWHVAKNEGLVDEFVTYVVFIL